MLPCRIASFGGFVRNNRSVIIRHPSSRIHRLFSNTLASALGNTMIGMTSTSATNMEVVKFDESSMSTFCVNGQHYTITAASNETSSPRPITLLDVIQYFNYDAGVLIVEYNKLICPKTNWDKVIINGKDQIEIITIVGGG